MKTIKFSDIKPVGNFKEILELLRNKADEAIKKAHDDKAYHKGLSDLIKLICGELALVVVLEDGITKNEGWDMDEMMICLLYTHLLVIDLNQTAHTYLNKRIDWDSPMKQLQEHIDFEPKIYNNLQIIE